MEKQDSQTKAKSEFRTHLIIYIVVISFLAIINLNFSKEYLWFKWPLLGWGVAIIIHALSVYNPSEKSTK